MNQQFEEIKVEIVPDDADSDPFKKSRRTVSMDVSSKIFIPTTKRNSSQKKDSDSSLQQQQALPQQYLAAQGMNSMMSQSVSSPYDLMSKMQSAEQAAGEEHSANIDYRVTGRLKFFNEGQSYGFIVSDIDAKDLFFHFDDMKKTNLSK